MNKNFVNRAKNLINDYFDQLINKIDINAEDRLSKTIDFGIVDELNRTRSSYLNVINLSREKSLLSLSNQISEILDEPDQDDELVLSIVFKKEYFLFIESIYPNDHKQSIGKLIKMNQYIPNKVLNHVKNFLNHALNKEGFSIINLDQDILRAYLLVKEFDPDIDLYLESNDDRKDIWSNNELHESKSIFPTGYQRIDLEFVEIQEISNQAFFGLDNIVELSLDNCYLGPNSFSFNSCLENLKKLSISNNSIEYLGSKKLIIIVF